MFKWLIAPILVTLVKLLASKAIDELEKKGR